MIHSKSFKISIEGLHSPNLKISGTPVLLMSNLLQQIARRLETFLFRDPFLMLRFSSPAFSEAIRVVGFYQRPYIVIVFGSSTPCHFSEGLEQNRCQRNLHFEVFNSLDLLVLRENLQLDMRTYLVSEQRGKQRRASTAFGQGFDFRLLLWRDKAELSCSE